MEGGAGTGTWTGLRLVSNALMMAIIKNQSYQLATSHASYNYTVQLGAKYGLLCQANASQVLLTAGMSPSNVQIQKDNEQCLDPSTAVYY
jgi:hypothetical protein